MEILDLVDGTPCIQRSSGQDDFMNPRKLQRREKPANAQAAPSAEYQPGVDNLIRRARGYIAQCRRHLVPR